MFTSNLVLSPGRGRGGVVGLHTRVGANKSLFV